MYKIDLIIFIDVFRVVFRSRMTDEKWIAKDRTHRKKLDVIKTGWSEICTESAKAEAEDSVFFVYFVQHEQCVCFSQSFQL